MRLHLIIYRRIALKDSDFRKFSYIKGTKKRARVPICAHRASCTSHKADEADDGAQAADVITGKQEWLVDFAVFRHA